MENCLNIKQLEMNHINIITEALYEADINRSEDYFNLCLLENELHKRITLLAFYQKEFAGYINIIFNSRYAYFYKNRIPEINDFFVMPKYREKGIGTKLLQAAERIVLNNYGRLGLGVGLYKDFGPAQNVYIANGYLPDANNNSYSNHPGNSLNYSSMDDEFMIYLYKKLK